MKQTMMILPKQSIEDEFFLSHLENQTNLEAKWIMEDTKHSNTCNWRRNNIKIPCHRNPTKIATTHPIYSMLKSKTLVQHPIVSNPWKEWRTGRYRPQNKLLPTSGVESMRGGAVPLKTKLKDRV